MTASKRLYLVSCVARKTAGRAKARDLYQSPWFRLARRYVEKSGSPWFILSARHGLTHPDQEIAPYDETLNRMAAASRRDWADKVQRQMQEKLPAADEVVILAGKRYRENLEDYLQRRFGSVQVPMRGMRIGEQLSWLKQHV